MHSISLQDALNGHQMVLIRLQVALQVALIGITECVRLSLEIIGNTVYVCGNTTHNFLF